MRLWQPVVKVEGQLRIAVCDKEQLARCNGSTSLKYKLELKVVIWLYIPNVRARSVLLLLTGACASGVPWPT